MLYEVITGTPTDTASSPSGNSQPALLPTSFPSLTRVSTSVTSYNFV